MLLHNPEHHFNDSEGPSSAEGYYDRLERAFEFLEECVSANRIRFYGISSNAFADPTDLPGTTDLHRVLPLAKRVGGEDHHFRIIQFPLNLLERGAITRHHRGTSLIALAKESGILTMTNRPFNAKGSNGLVRIAAKDTPHPSASELASAYKGVALAIQRRLLTVEGGRSIRDFPVLRYLQDHWPNLGHPDAVEELFLNHMLPLARVLWPEDLPHNEQLAECEKLFEYGLAHAASGLAREALALRRKVVEEGLADAGDLRPMSAIACDTYLRWGANHVLVGMRSRTYVDELGAFLQPAQHQPTRQSS
jgi:hypothetical protein